MTVPRGGNARAAATESDASGSVHTVSSQDHSGRKADHIRIAIELGLLFQIVDDILDVAGDEDELGKAVGADERQGKVTYVSFYGLARARELASESHLRAVDLLAAVPGPTEDLAALTELIFARQS